MNKLSELLHEAADPTEPTFTVDDVARRVGRRQQRRRVASALAALVFVVGLAGLAVGSQQDPDAGVAEPDLGPAPIVDDLTRERWVGIGGSADSETWTALAWLDLGTDGRFRGFTGCRAIDGRWSIERDRLVVDDPTYGEPVDNESCAPPMPATEHNVIEVLAAKPLIDRYVDSEGDDILQLAIERPTGPEARGNYVAFRPLDSYATPSATDLDGSWSALGGDDVVFTTDGDAIVFHLCPDERWVLAGGRLTDDDGDGLSSCPPLGDGGVRWSDDGPIEVRGNSSMVRTDAPEETVVSALYLSSRSGLSVLGRNDGPSDQEPPLKNQSVADAERDGIVPAVAELPASVRIEPLHDMPPVATDEGNWIVSRLDRAEAMPYEGDGSCGLGDTGNPDAVYRRDVVCTIEYGEVLLLDADDRWSILRAYPFAGVPPQWLVLLDGILYCGRAGDGGLPDSMLCRIDPATGEATVRIFPSTTNSSFTDAEPDHLPAYWTVGSPAPGVDFGSLRSEGGTLVLADGTRVDPDTLELLG